MPSEDLWEGAEIIDAYTQQALLLSGFDCPPGQQDLFDTDAEPGRSGRGG